MKQLGQIIREIVPVIIGILIALLINNWNESRKDKKYLNQIFSTIEEELKETNLDIKRVVPLQLSAIDTIDAYMNNEELSLFEIMIRAGGIQLPTIKTNAWNALSNSKIELIDYEKLSALADIEERKENLISRIDSRQDFLFQNFEESDKGKKLIYKMMVIDAINAEKRLQSAIEEILKNNLGTAN